MPDDLANATAAVLILSESCATCHELARELSGGEWPEPLWVLLAEEEGGRPGGLPSMADQYALQSPRLIRDTKRGIPERIGLTVSPAAFLLRDGRFEEARTVPSMHQLDLMLQEVSTVRK